MELGPLTREERILSLTPVVERFARTEASHGSKSFEDVVGWAWITAIRVSDKYHDLDGDKLEDLVAIAIRRREIDRQRSQFCIDRRNNIRRADNEWFKEVTLDRVIRRRQVGSSDITDTENRILVSQLHKILPAHTSGPGDREALRERAWNITYSTVALEQRTPVVAREFGISERLVRRIKDATLAKIALAYRTEKQLGTSPA